MKAEKFSRRIRHGLFSSALPNYTEAALTPFLTLDGRPTWAVEQAREQFVIGDHEDYAAPLAVRWLCKPCHRRIQHGPILQAQLIHVLKTLALRRVS